VRRSTTILLAALVLLLAGWVMAPPASACSCAGGTTADHLDRADTVFTGRLLSREVAGGSSSTDPALHVFAVESVWKGSARAEQGVVSASSGASCGLELSGEGPFLVFATRTGSALAAGLCGGTAPWTPDLEADLAALSTTATPHDPEPGAAGTALPGGGSWSRVLLGAAGLAAAGVATGFLVRRRAVGRAVPR
jgi:hypothetical protein